MNLQLDARLASGGMEGLFLNQDRIIYLHVYR